MNLKCAFQSPNNPRNYRQLGGRGIQPQYFIRIFVQFALRSTLHSWTKSKILLTGAQLVFFFGGGCVNISIVVSIYFCHWKSFRKHQEISPSKFLRFFAQRGLFGLFAGDSWVQMRNWNVPRQWGETGGMGCTMLHHGLRYLDLCRLFGMEEIIDFHPCPSSIV